MPLFLSIMAHYWLPNERLTRKKLFGIILGIVGLFMAMNIQLDGSLWIMLLGLSSAVSWAIANLIFKLKLKHANARSEERRVGKECRSSGSTAPDRRRDGTEDTERG